MLFGVVSSLVLLFASSISAAPSSPAPSQSVHVSSSPSSSQFLPTQSLLQSPSLTVYQASQSSQTGPLPTVHENEGDSGRQRSRKIMMVVLGSIAGSIIFGFLIAILRCTFKYKRPPKRDRIAEILQRHNLQCEMEELERNPYALRPPLLREPAPPYFPRPPSYSESRTELRRETTVATEFGTEHSRPNSPHTSGFPTTRD